MSPDNQVRQSDGSYVDVGQRLRGLREERRMSLRETARQSGVSVNALSWIEHGMSCPP